MARKKSATKPTKAKKKASKKKATRASARTSSRVHADAPREPKMSDSDRRTLTRLQSGLRMLPDGSSFTGEWRRSRAGIAFWAIARDGVSLADVFVDQMACDIALDAAVVAAALADDELEPYLRMELEHAGEDLTISLAGAEYPDEIDEDDDTPDQAMQLGTLLAVIQLKVVSPNAPAGALFHDGAFWPFVEELRTRLFTR
jgi:hypothetical protein